MNPNRYITEIDEKTLKFKVVIPCINEEGYRTLLIKNKEKSQLASINITKNLVIKKNTVLENNGNKYYCHIISLNSSNNFVNYNFEVMYEYLFKKIEEPIDEYEFSSLIYSLEELFSKKSESTILQQVGIAGELLTLLYIYNNGYKNILNAYHKNIFSRHDIELTNEVKLEIKTTTNSSRIHKFNHEQLTLNNFTVYISSVKLVTTEVGMTLFELFNILQKHTVNYETSFLLSKLMNYCDVSKDNQGIVFSYEQSYENIKFYSSATIPKIIGRIEEGISDIYYNVNCDFAKSVDIDSFIPIQLK